jgi:hypothetical protein
MESLVLILVAAVVFFVYKENKKDKTKEQPEAVKSHAGSYAGTVTPPDNNAWGDGTNPHEAEVLAANPEWRGLGYRLGGSFSLVVADDGKLSGTVTLWGNVIAITGGQIPAGQNTVTFTLAGAVGELTFDDGKVTGRVCEPHDCEHKYGIILGARV